VRAWIGSWLFVLAAAALGALPAAASTGTVNVNWYVTGVVKFSLIPNYNSGYGPVLATFGTQPAPSPGANACLQGCVVDFGTVQQGSSYLYKYAAHLQVVTNDTNGFNVYGEGAADFTDGAGDTMPLSQTLFYLPSGATSDSNTGFSPGLAFNVTSGSVTPAVPDPNTAPSIAYVAYPAPMFTSSAATNDFYQDYELKVPYSAAAVNYFAWIVYTVVPQ
jgi:hypothetical protein